MKRQIDTNRRLCLCCFLIAFGLSEGFAQWTRQSNGLPSDTTWSGFAIVAADTNCAVFTAGRHLYRTVDGGFTWAQIADFGPSVNAVDISMIDSSHIWAAIDSSTGTGGYDPAIFATGDGGQHWARQYHDPAATGYMNYIKMFDLNYGVAMGDPPGYGLGPTLFLNTTDGGEHWISMNDSALGYSGNLWAFVSFVNSEVGYFYGDGTFAMFKTTNGGSSWAGVNIPFRGITVMKFYDSHLGLAFPMTYPHQAIIYRTLDAGATWDSYSTLTSAFVTDIEFAPDDPSKVWMCDFTHVFFSEDTGKTWQQQLSAPWLHDGADLAFADSHHGWFLGDGHVYHTSDGGALGPDGIMRGPYQPPEAVTLGQNFPNPFNPSTGIRFQVPVTSLVRLEVFDVLGREVETLVNERRDAGSYTIRFDGSRLASGVYFYRLSAGRYVETRKMVLMK